MGAAIGQRQSEQKRFDAKNLSKIGNNRDATSFPNEHRITIESTLEGGLRRLAVFRMGVGHIPRARMTGRHLETYSRRTVFPEMLLRQRRNFVPVLIRDE